MKLFLDAIQFIHNLMELLPHIENIYHLHFLDLLCFLWTNIWTTTSKIYFMAFVIHQLNWINNIITFSHWRFQISLISWTKLLKHSNSLSTTSFASVKFVNFSLLLFECITCSFLASFENIKLIVIVNWISHVSEFWRSIIIFLK